MIRDILKPIAWKTLYKVYKAKKRIIKVHNFKTARSVGLLWNPKDKDAEEAFEYLWRDLKQRGLKIKGLAYLDIADKSRKSLGKHGSELFVKKEVGLLGKPKSQEAIQFMEEAPDILIDLSIKKEFPLLSVLVRTNSPFKVGRASEEFDFNDFSVDIPVKQGCKHLAEQLIFYLDRIR